MDKVTKFRERAKQFGYNDAEIDQFVSERQNEPISADYNPTGTDYSLDTKNEFASSVLPSGKPITQQFGNYNPEVEKYSGGINYGVDIGVPAGTKISLPQTGNWEVVDVYNGGGMNDGYGNSILVRDKKTGEKLRFSHLSKIANIKKGDEIEGGKLVALSGATGNVTGPHLDLEYYDENGKVRDVLQSRYGRYL